MSDTLFGKEVSGTPLETRGLANDVAGSFSSLISTPDQGAQRISEMFGINFAELGLTDFASGILSGDSPSLAGFEQANQPFQQRAINQSRGQTAAQFGTSGGRFSRNLSGAQSQGDAQLQQGFDQNRFQFNAASRGQDIQALSSLLGSIPSLQQASLAPLNSAANFAQVGAPIFQQGIAGELLAAGGSLLGGGIAGGLFSNLFGGDGGGGGGGPTSARVPRPVADFSQFIPQFQPDFRQPSVSVGPIAPFGR